MDTYFRVRAVYKSRVSATVCHSTKVVTENRTTPIAEEDIAQNTKDVSLGITYNAVFV
jgi:hypothetical protein